MYVRSLIIFDSAVDQRSWHVKNAVTTAWIAFMIINFGVPSFKSRNA